MCTSFTLYMLYYLTFGVNLAAFLLSERLFPASFLLRFLPESVRWLLLNNKVNEAKEQLARVAKFNRKPFPDDDLKIPDEIKTGNIFQVFSNREITKTILICWDIW